MEGRAQVMAVSRPRPALDPELIPGLELLPPALPLYPESFHTDLREGRKRFEAPPMPEVDDISVKDITVETSNGELGLRIVTPDAPRADRPCLFWIHGGGYFLGSAFDPDARLVKWVQALDCVIVSVHYRLAPEHPYPAALEDCYAGLQWTVANAAELGIDLKRIAIAGISAGGGLCAALALRAKELEEITPCFQLLIYPMIDDLGQTQSSTYDDSPIWNQAINELAWKAYLGPDHLIRDVPITAAPSRATVADLRGLPPAYLCVGTVDIFCDEDINYANALLEAGVPTELHVYPGGFHGFDALVPGSRIARTFNRDVVEALQRALNPL